MSDENHADLVRDLARLIRESKPFPPNTVIEILGKAADELDRLRRELEIERMRLAACGVVAMADTPESAALARDMLPEYRSAACDDVARRVDECIRLRRELAEAREFLNKTAKDVDDIATDHDLCDVPMQLREVARDLRAFLTPSPPTTSHDAFREGYLAGWRAAKREGKREGKRAAIPCECCGAPLVKIQAGRATCSQGCSYHAETT